MMMMIPTYVVTFDETDYRVPSTNLESFLHVLLFNGVNNFSVRLEEQSENDL
jgi:hypothetical protein